MANELTVNLQIDASSECLKRLCDGLAAAVKPNGGYEAATTDDPAPGTGGDQMVQVEWWIPQHGCDSLENTLDAIKGRLAVAVRDWWATALIPATPPAPEVVPVAERPWEQDGWCDAEGQCWALSPDHTCWQLRDPRFLSFWVLLLPSHAIPLPQGGEGEG